MHNIVVLFLFLSVITAPIMADQNVASREDIAKTFALFAVNMYSNIVLQKPNENVIFSPFSIQTCAAMARVGAENETAAELDRGLGLNSTDLTAMADNFYKILSLYENSDILKIANKIYVKDKYVLQSEFNELLTKKFLSAAESINFDDKNAAAQRINSWVESKTNNLIKELISSDDISEDTRLVLLNAIHFKGKWSSEFDADLTADDDFYLNEKDVIQVPMMNIKKNFKYAHLPELEAAVLELPYKDSDLSMLIILPDARTGLKDLEQKLANIKIADIAKKMYDTKVIVRIPKWKTEFSIELTEPFKQMGMTRMFTDQAEFGKMLQKQSDLKVSKIIHKAFIEVNEEGTEAAAATGMHKWKKRSLPIEYDFIADHAFVYVVTSIDKTNNSLAPIFMGTLKAPTPSNIVSEHDEL